MSKHWEGRAAVKVARPLDGSLVRSAECSTCHGTIIYSVQARAWYHGASGILECAPAHQETL